MSSAEEENAPFTKKRKLQRACDHCRRKKIKCDGPEKPQNRCTRCEARHIECTYNDPHIKSSYPSSYVENLESRLERMERLMSKLCPDSDISNELGGHASDRRLAARDSGSEGSRAASTSRVEGPSPLSSLPITTPQMPESPDEAELSDNDEAVDEGLIESLRKLSVSPQPYRYHGKSSGLVLIRTAIELRNQQFGYTGQVEPQERAPHRYPWLKPTSQDSSRPLFDDFPPDDLLESLTDIYFRKVNDMLPLLHEPTFRAGLSKEVHLRDSGFGAVVLLVCASAARFTSDSRVLLEGTEDWRSAGWKWFQAVEDWHKVSLAPAQLHDLQICVLMANFLLGSTAPQANWTLIGSGIRMAVDVGAHRKKMYNTKPTIEDELWRRAFWILVVFEWSTSYGLGRPASIHDEDIDVALPTEVDDEYWTTSGSGEPPRQPEGKPSKLAFLGAYIRLTRNLAFASRTIYSINKTKPQLGQGDSQWEERIVAELDSSLNKWLDSLPAHLRWNPDQPDALFLTQSATLHANFYHTQIAVHRPFMSASRHDSPLSLPSVIICTNAARSSIQVLDGLYKRIGNPYHRNMGLIFMSGVVLMMNVWGQQRAGRITNVDQDIAILRRAMVLLDSLKSEVQVASALRDLLEQLILAVNNPPPSTDSAPRQATTNPSNRSAGNSASASATVPPQSAPQGLHPASMPAESIAGQAGSSIGDRPVPSSTGAQFMFGHEPLAFGGADFSSERGPSSGFGWDQQHMSTAVGEGSHGAFGDPPTPDFALMDDTLSMWTNAPASFRLDDWGAYLSGANNSMGSGPGT
ncbi:fungal-specific transcription factor domain-containing protein [Cerioporus squamosus]|nr:fungal-specific transcription factor domain-containing protein [Cerioporus squamosus]